jgi:ketosteroid isomerase-like protein
VGRRLVAQYFAPMSDENVEIVRRAIDAFNADGVDGLVAFGREDMVTYPIPEWIEDDEYRGHEGLQRVLSWQYVFDRLVWEPLDLRAVGPHVVVHARLIGETKTGGEINQQFGALCSAFRDGLVGELRFFRTWREALDAAEGDA